jgi:KaiC/GvpD/RAD55 family RecA-like ATPase
MTLRERVEQAIQQRGVKRKGGELYFRCPRSANHANGDANVSARWNSEKGTWFCDVCNIGGGYKDLAELLGIQAPKGDTPAVGGIVATYDYRDERRELLFQVVRFEGKKFPQRRPDGKGGWIYDLNSVRRVLYRLPELLAADPTEPVFLPEGEKDVQNLTALGLIATCNPSGAGKWRDEYSQALRGRHVVVLPDYDEPGRKHAQQVAQSLSGVAASVRVVELPGLPAKGDVSDWLAAGHTKEELLELVAATQTWQPSAEAEPKAKLRLRVVTLHGLLSLELPPRETILAPWLWRQALAMIYAPRGVGKTYFALHVAYAVASASEFLRFRAPKARRVLLVDGEMPAAALQDRLARIVQSAEAQPPEEGFVRILAADLQEMALPDLATVEGQSEFEEHLEDAELLILDNLSTLCRRGVENESESWIQMQAWLLSLRRRGIAVLLVHHAGKGGQQRGTSKREDVLDTIIALRRCDDYKASEGARFEVHFEKARGLVGEDVAPFEAQLTTDPVGHLVWTLRNLEDPRAARVRELAGAGLKQREIASKLSLSQATVSRVLKSADSVIHGMGCES